VPEHDAPVSTGDRFLLRPHITGLAEPAWGEVEIVEHVDDPTSFPWNAGRDYPYRVGFRVDRPTKQGGLSPRRGMIWLNAEGHDAMEGVGRIDFAAGRAPSQQT
jgi:hypothetical protein